MSEEHPIAAAPDRDLIHQTELDQEQQEATLEERDQGTHPLEGQPVGYWCDKGAHTMCLGVVIPQLDQALKMVKCACVCHR